MSFVELIAKNKLIEAKDFIFNRLDEVAASLRYALIERRIEEGMYWTEELLDSEEYGLLLRVITDVWVFSLGPFSRLSLLPAIAAAATAATTDGSSCSSSFTECY